MKIQEQQIFDELKETYSLLNDVVDSLNRRKDKNKSIDTSNCNESTETAREAFENLDNMD